MTNYTFQQIAIPGADLGTWLGGINNAGQVVGYSMSTAAPVAHSFIDTGGSFTPVTTQRLHPEAADINNSGQVVGTDGSPPTGINGFLWNPDGSSQEIPYPGLAYNPDFIHAYGINDTDQVVGVVRGGIEGFLWQNGAITPLNVPGATVTEGHGINNAGVIVGSADNHGFIDTGGQITDISFAGAKIVDPMAINNNGTIAGSYNDGTHWHGFIDAGGQITFINAPSAVDTWVTGINDSGTISGYSDATGGGVTQGFIATDPVDPSEAIVREDYLAAFARDADPGGLSGWAGAVRAGMTPAQLANDLAGSAEFQGDHGGQSDAGYVDSLYVNALGRHAEAGGLSGWVGAIQGGWSRGDVLAAIAQSPEGQQHFAAAHG